MTSSRRWLPDAIAGIIVLAVVAIVVWHARGRSFDPVVDAGRDLYIADELRSGATLYRDIVYIFPPLAPYLLAAITAVTGTSLAAFEWIGVAIALATAAAVYALVRTVGSAPAAGAAATMFAACSVYSVSGRASNYLLPYSQAATIGMLLFTAGGALLVARRRWSIPLGLVALVAASCAKIEYAVFAVVVIVVAAFVHRVRWYLIALLGPVAVLVWHFASGEANLFSAPVASLFYREVTGLDAWPVNAIAAVVGFGYIAAIAGAIAIASRSGRAGLAGGAIVVAIIGWYAGLDFFRGWLIAQLLLVPFVIRRAREPVVLLLAMSLCASSRLVLHMTPEWYGFVFLVPVYGLLAYAAIDWLPWYSRRAALLWLIPIAIVSIEMVLVETAVMSQKRFPVVSARGTFFDMNPDRAATLNEFLAYANAQRIDSLVVIPEGLGIDYLANARTPLRFHTFNPLESGSPWIEREIIREMESRRPPYIAIVTRVLADFGSRGFGADYDRQLASEIRSRYRVDRVWRRPAFELILLKRR